MAAPYYNIKSRKTGTLRGIKLKMWRTADAVERAMNDAKTPEDIARLSYAQTNVCREMRLLLEASELEKRIEEVEAALKLQGAALSVN